MHRSLKLKTAYGIYSYLNSMFCKFLDLMPPFFRTLAFKLIFAEFGKGSSIDYGFKFRYGKKIAIGKNVTISSSCEFYPGYLVRDSEIYIGDHVTMGPSVMLIGAGHEPKTMLDVGGPIAIENGVYIGARSLIRYGVTVGENSIIAASSIVTKSILPNTLFIQKYKS